MFRAATIFIFLVCFWLNSKSQNETQSIKLTTEKVFLLLPDSCFTKFAKCVSDSSLFSVKNRKKLVINQNSNSSEELNIDWGNNKQNEFIMFYDKCKYATTFKFRWWNSGKNTHLIFVTLTEVDMCTERQLVYTFEYNGEKLKQKYLLPKHTVADFVNLKTLKKRNIKPATLAPTNLFWKSTSDTIFIKPELGPYWNCKDSYENSPLIRLKEQDVEKNEIKYIYKENKLQKVK